MINEIDATLCELRESLLSGNLQALDVLSPKIESLLETLRIEGAEPEALIQLRQTASDIDHILQSAHKGLLTARRRLAEIADVRGGLVTYSPEGARLVEHHAPEQNHRI